MMYGLTFWFLMSCIVAMIYGLITGSLSITGAIVLILIIAVIGFLLGFTG